jgi:hypothetical protein
MHDFYIRGLEKGFTAVGYSDNKRINVNIGYRARPHNIMGTNASSLACAILDSNGLATTAGWYWIYDLPYLTDGLGDLIDVAPAGSNGKATATPFYGFYLGTINAGVGFNTGFNQLTINKLNSSLVSVGSWNVPVGTPGASLHQMRFGALQKAARFAITSQEVPTTLVTANVTNLMTGSDNVIIALPFTGGTTAKAAICSHPDFDRVIYPTAGEVTAGTAVLLTAAADRAAVEAGGGTLFWQDTANNRVWIKLVGGMLVDPGNWGDTLHTPEHLYHSYHVQVRPA